MSFLRKIVALFFVFIPVFAVAQVQLETSYDEANSSIVVTMTNDVTVAGIQFDLVDSPEAFTVTGVTASFSNASDFVFNSNPNGTIIGFSFSGALVEAGTQTLCSIAIDLTGSYTEVSIQSPVFADAETNNLSVTTGNPIIIGEWTPTSDVYASFGALDGNTLPIMINSNVDIYGFQFKISDMPEVLNIVGASGGAAEDADWTVNSSADGVILGFTFSLNPITAGNQVLTNLELGAFSGAYTEIYFDDDFDFVFSDASGNTIEDVAHGDGFLWGDLPDVPEAPGNLTGETLGNSINLSWNASDLAEVYNVYRDGFHIASTGVTFFTDSGLNFGVEYTYHVTAENISSESANSNTLNISTEDTPPPPEPTGLVATSNDGSVLLEWNRPAVPVDGYEQCFETCDEFPWDLGLDHYVDGGNGGWFRGEDGAFSACGTGLNVCGADADGTAAIAIWTASGIHTESRMTTPPVDLTGNSSASLSYAGAYIYTDYATMDNLIEVSTDGGSTWTTVFTDSPFSTGDVIYEQNIDLSAYAGEVIVVAFNFRDNSYGEAWFVDDISVLGDAAIVSNTNTYPLNMPITGKRLNDLEGFGAHVTDILEEVEESRALVGYNIYRSESMGAGYALVEAINDEEEMYTDNSVMNGTTYYYVVTAQFDIEGESLYSNEAMATPMGTASFDVSSESVVGGNDVSVTVIVHNPDPASSVNFTLTGDSNVLTYSSLTSEGFPENWTLDASALANGSVIFSGFGSSDLSSGATITFTYNTSMGMPISVDLCTTMESIEDTNGNEFFMDSDCGSVDVTLDYSISLDVNITTESADVGEEVQFELLMSNTDDVYGVEFIISDNPNNITNISFESTARIPGDWDLTANENENGQIVVVGSGSPISAGNGALFTATSMVDEGALASNTTIYYSMASVMDNDMNYLYIEELGDDAFEVYPGFLPPAMNLVAESGFDGEVPLTWDSPQGSGSGGDDGGDDGGNEGVGEACEGCGAASCITDCELQCVDEATANSWIGDGYCDDGTWGMYLDCEFFDFDGGDCGDATTGGTEDCESLDEFTAYGEVDMDGDGTDDPCYDAGDGTLSAYMVFYWDAGCTATGIYYNGVYMDLTPYNFNDGSAGVIFYGLDPNTSYELQLESGATMSPTVTITTGDCQGAVANVQPKIDYQSYRAEKEYYEVQEVEFVMPEARNADRPGEYTKAPVVNRRELMELSYHDGVPTNGYYQSSVGYGVVYDLSEYGGASIEMVDFSHYGWGSADGGEYNLFVVNMENGVVLYETSGEALGAMSSNVWVDGIGLGGVIAPSSQIGVFIQPLSDYSTTANDDWYPCLDSDGTVGSSNSGIFDFDSNTFTANASVGNFLMDLWIDATPTNIDLDISNYNVFRSDDNGSTWNNIATSDTESYVDGDVTNGQEYQYYVTTEYEGMYESGASNVDSAVPSTWVTLSLTDANILNGTTGTVELSMANAEEVSGFQVDLTDTPNNLIITSASITGRVPTDWTVQANENAEGNVTLLAFSFSGTNIPSGDGPVFVLEFEANAAEPTNVALCTANEVITDTALPFGNEFPVNSGCSSVIADVEGIEILLSGPGGAVDQGGSFDFDFSVNNPYPIYGFEIHLEDTPEAVTSISGAEGSRLPAGGLFSVEENDGELIIIWFSLTLTPIDAGNGPLFTITYGVNEDATDGDMVQINITDETVFSDNLGNAMYYRQPDFYEFSVGAYDAVLSLFQYNQNSFNVAMVNTEAVSGFQVKVLDNPDEVSFSSVSFTDVDCNGNCIPGDWSVSGSESTAGGMNILGFSFTGTTIGTGSGAIANIEFNWDNDADSTVVCFGDEATEMTNTSNQTLYLEMSSCATLYNTPMSIDEIELPTSYKLVQNHPNPFNPSTTINFSIPEQSLVSLKVFDLSGRLVKTLVNGQMNVGHHAINWNGVDTFGNQVAAGMYIYTLEGRDLYMSRKMILMK